MPSSFPYLEKSRKYGSIPQNLIDSTGTAPVRKCSSEWPQLSSRRAKWLLCTSLISITLLIVAGTCYSPRRLSKSHSVETDEDSSQSYHHSHFYHSNAPKNFTMTSDEINNSKAIPSISYSTGNEVGLSGATPITTTARKALNPTKKFDPVETEVKMEVEGISKSRIGKTPPSPIISNADPDTEAKLTKKFYESQAPRRVRQQLVNQDDAQASL
mmetsp:Transcript_12953/g.20775  ORF Transcript_12953/g.20775 Transcript_12953/m.20775 type:complete len:214 (+) Transcript_12953:133-774(+)